MVKGLILLGLGAAGAVYFFDPDKGEKRRKQLRRQWKDTVKTTNEMWDEYAPQVGQRAKDLWYEYGPVVGQRAKDISQTVGSQALVYGQRAKTIASDYAKNGSKSWAPSARFVGALGSALAFYGAGRRGTTGVLLRTLSLGLFTKALMSQR